MAALQRQSHWISFVFITAAVIAGPHLVTGQNPTPPCDPTFTSCPAPACRIGGIQIAVHGGNGRFECCKFYHQRCDASGRTLVYEGPDSSICDCGYDPDDVQRYHVERFDDINGSSCSTFYDSCTSLWITGSGQPTTCP